MFSYTHFAKNLVLQVKPHLDLNLYNFIFSHVQYNYKRHRHYMNFCFKYRLNTNTEFKEFEVSLSSYDYKVIVTNKAYIDIIKPYISIIENQAKQLLVNSIQNNEPHKKESETDYTEQLKQFNKKIEKIRHSYLND